MRDNKKIIDISGCTYISTSADGAAELAREYGFGLEIAEFCTAYNMDIDFEKWDDRVKSQMNGLDRFVLHAPFNELCPAAIDPLVAGVTKKRYAQTYELMNSYDISTMIVHSGFLPVLYDEGWFAEKSIVFWKEFLQDKPDSFKLRLENVFERTPGMLCEIVKEVDDERFLLCLDIGHAAIGNADISVFEWMNHMLPFIGHIHLHNNGGKFDDHDALGEGIIDVAAIIHEAVKSIPEITFTMEPRIGKQSVDWLAVNGFLEKKKE